MIPASCPLLSLSSSIQQQCFQVACKRSTSFCQRTMLPLNHSPKLTHFTARHLIWQSSCSPAERRNCCLHADTRLATDWAQFCDWKFFFALRQICKSVDITANYTTLLLPSESVGLAQRTSPGCSSGWKKTSVCVAGNRLFDWLPSRVQRFKTYS